MKFPGVFRFLVFLTPFFLLECNGDSVDFHQKDIRVVHDHIVLKSVDKTFFENFTLKNQKFNRTARAFGAEGTLLRDFGVKKTVMINVAAFKFMSNVYKRYAPVRLSFNVCDALIKNSFGVTAVTTTNGNVTLCPVKKGRYYIDQFVTDDSKLPPYLPEGKYRLDLDFSEDGKSFGAFSWFGSIVKIKQL